VLVVNHSLYVVLLSMCADNYEAFKVTLSWQGDLFAVKVMFKLSHGL